jgi:hypothetical protein
MPAIGVVTGQRGPVVPSEFGRWKGFPRPARRRAGDVSRPLRLRPPQGGINNCAPLGGEYALRPPQALPFHIVSSGHAQGLPPA